MEKKTNRGNRRQEDTSLGPQQDNIRRIQSRTTIITQTGHKGQCFKITYKFNHPYLKKIIADSCFPTALLSGEDGTAN